MWVFLPCGFFSVVSKNKADRVTPDLLCVRARIGGDLERLRDQFMPGPLGIPTDLPESCREFWPERKEGDGEIGLYDIQAGGGTDYQYRAFVSRRDFVKAMSRVNASLIYRNFKGLVGEIDGHDRSHLYMGIWSAMYDAEKKIKRPYTFKREPTVKVGKRTHKAGAFDFPEFDTPTKGKK